ncbi:hypothetical protein HPHPP1_0100 [Helicobacter pylori Hp P-1]|nr:hypothetical protein HPHPP1_0100 [Helicobacter pylori Hp P-1]EJC22462.1 hypothetical protein HPHPP1B_0020 [Helicobacter pylori Hp P-1b]
MSLALTLRYNHSILIKPIKSNQTTATRLIFIFTNAHQYSSMPIKSKFLFI